MTERDGNQSIIEKPSPFVHSNTTPIDFRSRGSLDFRKPSVHGSATPNNYITGMLTIYAGTRARARARG